MTDATPTPEQPVTPPPAQPVTPPAAPAAPAAYAPAAAGPKQTMSLVGFIIGIGSVVFGWLALLGIGGGIAAIIISLRAKKSEPGAPSWMHTVGLITGIVGVVIGLISGIVFLASVLIPLFYVGSMCGAYGC